MQEDNHYKDLPVSLLNAEAIFGIFFSNENIPIEVIYLLKMNLKLCWSAWIGEPENPGHPDDIQIFFSKKNFRKHYSFQSLKSRLSQTLLYNVEAKAWTHTVYY